VALPRKYYYLSAFSRCISSFLFPLKEKEEEEGGGKEEEEEEEEEEEGKRYSILSPRQ